MKAIWPIFILCVCVAVASGESKKTPPSKNNNNNNNNNNNTQQQQEQQQQQQQQQELAKQPAPVEGVQAVMAAFGQHPIVALGEDNGYEHAGTFYDKLINDPGFQTNVNDIVIEWVSQSNQALLDRYISGETIPAADLAHLWRDTTKVAVWDCPIYAKFLATVREVNTKLPAGHHLRVVAGDTEIDWTKIKTHADFAALGPSNASFAKAINEQVLAKQHKGLLIMGWNHVRKDAVTNGPNATALVNQQHANSIYVIEVYLPPMVANTEFQKFITGDKAKPGCVFTLKDTPVGKLDLNGPIPMQQQADGLLYLGPVTGMKVVKAPQKDLEPAYVTEMDRRSVIISGSPVNKAEYFATNNN